MGCNGNHAFQQSQDNFSDRDLFGGIPGVSILSWGSKVGPNTPQGTCYMILIACFQRFFSIFEFFHTQKMPFPRRFSEYFICYDTGHLNDTKT